MMYLDFVIFEFLMLVNMHHIANMYINVIVIVNELIKCVFFRSKYCTFFPHVQNSCLSWAAQQH